MPGRQRVGTRKGTVAGGNSDKRWHPSMMCMRCRLTLREARQAVRDKAAKEDGGIGGMQQEVHEAGEA
jgi:hypothetical protein